MQSQCDCKDEMIKNIYNDNNGGLGYCIVAKVTNFTIKHAAKLGIQSLFCSNFICRLRVMIRAHARNLRAVVYITAKS
jgi:hypothetical protein